MRSPIPMSFFMRASAVVCVALAPSLNAAERISLAIDGEVVRGGVSFDFSADGDLIAVSRVGSVSILDSRNGDLVRRIELGTMVDQIAFSREGARIAVRSKDSGRISVWSCKTWESQLLKSPILNEARDVISLAFSPSGDKLVATSVGHRTKHAVHVWDTVTGNETAVVAKNHNLQLAGFSPDGRWLAASGTYGTGRGGKGALFLWNVEKFGKAVELSGAGVNGNFAFSPDGRMLAVHTSYPTEKQQRELSTQHSPGEVALWDLESMRRRAVLPGFWGSVVMSFSVDSRLLVASAVRPTGSWARTPGELVQVWDLLSGQRTVIERDSHASNVMFSPRGDYLLTSFATPTSGFRLRDTTGRIVETITQGKPQDVIGRMVFSPSGNMLAVSIAQSLSDEDRFCLWNLAPNSSQSDGQ